VRTTVLKLSEMVYRVGIRRSEGKQTQSAFIKVGTRQSMECSVVSVAVHIETNEAGIASRAGIALGAVAPTIRFAQKTCDIILGTSKQGNKKPTAEEFADSIMQYAQPISDLRASAWYRNTVLRNLALDFFGGKRAD
jgi:CO/xanthine dehydrogenase FAD-binding subunit